MDPAPQGLTIVYTGNGKGKTTAAMGQTLRAAGQGLNVLILQFMKGQPGIGVVKALANCRLPIELKQFGRAGFVQTRNCEPLDRHLAHQGLAAFVSAMDAGTWDMIVLDEINVAIDFGLLPLESVLAALRKKPPRLHLILTGRNAHRRILALADIATEMRELKHSYTRGIPAQRGVEF